MDPLTPGLVNPSARLRAVLGHRVLRYLLVGGGLFALDAAVFLLLVRGAGWDLRVAQLVSRAVGASAGFFGHRAFTFGDRPSARGVAGEGAGYLGVTLFNLAVSPLVVALFAAALPFSLLLAKVAAEVVLVSQTYFLLRLVFRTNEGR